MQTRSPTSVFFWLSVAVGSQLTVSGCILRRSVPNDTSTSAPNSPVVNSELTIGTAIVFSAVTSSTFSASWGAASDTVDDSADLVYKIYVSNTDNISTIDSAQGNGTYVEGFTANLLGVNFGGFPGNQTVYLAVLVSDSSGNLGLYHGSVTLP